MIAWPWKKGHDEDLTESRQALHEVTSVRNEQTTKVVDEIHDLISRNNFGDKFHRALGGRTR